MTKFWTGLNSTRLQTDTDDKIYVSKKMKYVFRRVENIVGKVGTCWLPAFCPFPTIFPKYFLYWGVKSCDCVV